MRILHLFTLAGLSVALSSTASAQFSASGPGSAVPTAGSGGTGSIWTTVLPATPGISVAAVGVAVNSVDSIDIDGFSHTWIGDLQVVLSDPNGVGHLIMLRPGVDFGGSTVGNSGDFLGGTYTFVESGGLDLPVDTTGVDQIPGIYNQTFSTGTTTWPSGQLGINNTPLSQISGPAGNWTLTIYDWAGGDTGAFSGWSLNGNGGGGGNSGSAFCFGDGSGALCPCNAFGGVGQGCMTTSGTGMTLAGSGNADVANDSFVLSVSGGPANKNGIFFQGPNVLGFPAGDGIVCSNSNLRYGVIMLDGTGSASGSGFGVNTSSGSTLNYQFWFRDPTNTCTGFGFNFSNAWTVTWN